MNMRAEFADLSAQALPVKLKDIGMAFSLKGQATKALDAISLSINAGEFVSIVGPSGCGKSTLLRLIVGLLKPTEGEVLVDDKPVDRALSNLGFVFQDSVLLEWRNALANVMLQAEMRKDRSAKTRERAVELLKAVGLASFMQHYPHQLSGGMRQRVSICRALLHNPPLLLMDEPFGALDALSRDQLTVDLQDIWLRSRKTVVFVTHNVSEAVFLSDRIVVMSARPGRIVADIPVDLPRPRTLAMYESPKFIETSHKVYEIFKTLGVIHDTRAS
jgi:NitT/TauT family transport system ATP-binding protein